MLGNICSLSRHAYINASPLSLCTPLCSNTDALNSLVLALAVMVNGMPEHNAALLDRTAKDMLVLLQSGAPQVWMGALP